MSSIDGIGLGFLGTVPDANRYGHSLDPNGVSGFISTMIPRHSRVLDVGCGNGSLAEILRVHCGAQVFGIEPDPSRASDAVRRGIPVFNGFLDADFPNQHGLFDVVLFADVLEHVADPFSLLQCGISCVVPGGSVIVSVPNIAHWSVRVPLLAGRFKYEKYGIMDATHLRWFTKASLLEFLRRSKLTPIDVRSTPGMSLDAYRRWPWNWMPRVVVSHFAIGMARVWPTMFGCQTVVRSLKPGS